MKGIMLIEFAEFAELQLAAATAARVADHDLPAADHYRATERYDHTEMVRLVGIVAGRLGLDSGEVLRRFGTHLFERFAAMYPLFLADADDTLSFVSGIDTWIHGELRQLYPDGEFPSIECHMLAQREVEMVYRSPRPFADLAEGLIRGCADHFGETIRIERDDTVTAGSQVVRFHLRVDPKR